jgi:flavin reductase (DIM6/NTAB) family NADH-FMN oxidoreductase RutF
MDGTLPIATDSFNPASDPRGFRAALGAFATGVTIVTVMTDSGPVGITANSFASVSLDPPLILWSPARASSRFAAFAGADHFAIHVLAHDQADAAQAFTRGGAGFGAVSWAVGAQGLPLIEGTLARFVCATQARHDGGDHLIIIGRVLDCHHRLGAPLVFQAGRYAGLTPTG